MIKAEGPDRFRVEFGAVKRSSGWKRLFSRDVVVVDAFAIGKALIAAINACPMRTASGAPQVWNEFRLFLARPDHDRLRPLEHSLQRDLMPMLYEEMVRLNAVTVGGIVLRLLVDDAEEVEEGSGFLQVRYAADVDPGASAGEITVRLDKPMRPPEGPTPTAPVALADAVLRTPSGDLHLASGVRYTLGRAHGDAGPDHIALPGASSRINRRQFSLRVEGGQVEVVREPGNSNPVQANGQALGPGQGVVLPMPVELVLSGGELRATVERG